MDSENYPETDSSISRIINLQDHYSSKIMDVRSRKLGTTSITKAQGPPSFRLNKKKMENQRSFSQASNGRRLLPGASYFSLESFLLLICLTASLLILPVVLPPLPPPPFLLLLLPIGILALLMILAFMPAKTADLTYTCA